MEAFPTELDPAVLARMTPDDRMRAHILLRRRVPLQPFKEFIPAVSPHLPPPSHIQPVIQQVELGARVGRRRVCIAMPPRHAKTTTLLHGFAWWLKHYPADTCGYFTYGERQARSKSRIAFRLAIEAQVALDPASKDMSEWRTVEQGGLLAGGAGGALTGQGIQGLFVIDDPYKNRQEADSIVIRERIWEWFNEVVMTRLEGGTVVVVHTRWHQDDLIGRLSEMEEWDVINLPAVAEEDDVLGREEGEPLWPKRFPMSHLERTRRQIGDWSFAALYQGRPQPRGSNIFREPARFKLPQTPEEWADFLKGKYLLIACDPAASEKTHADYSVAGVLAADGLGPEATFWLLKVVRGQWTIPVLVAKLIELQKYWRARIAVEAVSGFKAVPQMLKNVNPDLSIIEIKPTTDKFQRAQGCAAAWNDGRVLVPAGQGCEDWVDAFMTEMTSFSGVKDPHDDQVDMLCHGWNTLANTTPRRPRRSRRSRGAFG
jgi:predicted phage terminase large subunit-like protein